MPADQGWCAPAGSMEVEPGCRQAADGTVYVDAAVWEMWERDLQARVVRVREHENRCRVRRMDPTVADYRVVLAGAMNANHDLVAENDWLVAQVAFLEDLLASVLAER